jgi:drug/metabolite transporter (DMT)-like permease
VLAAALWGLGSFIAQRVSLPPDPLVTTGWQMLFGGLLFAAAGLAAGEGSTVDVAEFSTKSVIAFAYLVVVGSIVAFSAYSYALAHAPISQVSTYAYVNPVIAVVLGAVILGEHVAGVTVAGMALIIASVAIIVRREARARQGQLHETTQAATVRVASRN